MPDQQPDYVDRRLRYYDGQFLHQQDFTDEQHYHLDRRRRLTRILYSAGVLEGFDVAPVANAARVKVARGTAVDGAGRLLVRADDSEPVDVSDKVDKAEPVTVIVAVTYDEHEADAAPGGASTRWQEAPAIVTFLEGDQQAPSEDTHVRLARLQVASDGTVTVDPAFTATRRGLGLRGPLSVTGAATFHDAVSGPPASPLRVSGDVQLTGPRDFDSSVRLLVTNGSADYGRTNLVLSGRFQAGNDAWNFGSSARNSIVFASNAANSGENIGAVGDEQVSLQVEGNSNSLGILTRQRGANPAVIVHQDGSVGVGRAPSTTLDVNGSLTAAGPAGFRRMGRWTAHEATPGGAIQVVVFEDSFYNYIVLRRDTPITQFNVVVPGGQPWRWLGRYFCFDNRYQFPVTSNIVPLDLGLNGTGLPLTNAQPIGVALELVYVPDQSEW